MINRYHGTIALISELKTKIALEGEMCTCLETNTTYKYLTAGSTYTADDKYVLITGSGGDTRWVGIAGRYGIYGTVTDHTKFEADGTMVAMGGAICYRDEYPTQWITPTAGGASLANYTIGGVSTRKYGFNGTATANTLSASFEIPHDMAVAQVNAGTLPLEMHIHFAPAGTGTGDVRWVVNYCQNKVSGATPVAEIAITNIKNIPTNKQYFNILTGFNLAIPSGGWDIGDTLEFSLSRDPTDAADTYGGIAILYQVALHIPVDTLGSRTTYTK